MLTLSLYKFTLWRVFTQVAFAIETFKVSEKYKIKMAYRGLLSGITPSTITIFSNDIRSDYECYRNALLDAFQ